MRQAKQEREAKAEPPMGSLSLSNEGGGQEMKKQRLYIRVKGMKVPKNKREGIDTSQKAGRGFSQNSWTTNESGA
jgi:hypothetical protein